MAMIEILWALTPSRILEINPTVLGNVPYCASGYFISPTRDNVQHDVLYMGSPCQAARPRPLPEADLYSASHRFNSVTDTERQPQSMHTHCGSATAHELAFFRPNARVGLPSARRSKWLVVTAGVFRWHSLELISLAHYAVSFCNCFIPYTKGVRTVTDCSL